MGEQKVFVMDGAIGSYLRLLYDADCLKKGINSQYADFLRLDHFDLMEQLHKDYIQAGADIIKTGTFNLGNRAELSLSSLENKATRYAQIAKQTASNSSVKVWGSLGPIYGNTSAERTDRYRAVIDGLLNGGITNLYFETYCHFNQLIELKELLGTYAYSENEIHLSLTPKEKTTHLLSGESFTKACEILKDIPTQSVGLNCMSLSHVHVIKEMLHLLKHYTERPLSLSPSLGILHRGVYPLSEEETLRGIQTLLSDQQITYIGGCCGIHPKFIEKLTKFKKY